MNKLAILLCDKLESLDLHYKVDEPENSTVITFGMKTENTTVTVRAFIEDEDNHIALRSFGVIKTPMEKYADVLIACNECNNEYRWVKFSIDEDCDLNVASDVIVSEENVGDVVLEIIIRMYKIVDEVYPRFMKAIWSD